MSETKEFRKSYFRESESKNDFKGASFNVWCYRGAVADPKWKDVDTSSVFIPVSAMLFISSCPSFTLTTTGNYTKLCTIDVDLSYLPLAPRKKPSSNANYFRLDYDIVLLFGLTELKAQVAWKEGVSHICVNADGLLLIDRFLSSQGVEKRLVDGV